MRLYKRLSECHLYITTFAILSFKCHFVRDDSSLSNYLTFIHRIIVSDCNFDGGDCCGSCISEKYCAECACLNEEVYYDVGIRYCFDTHGIIEPPKILRDPIPYKTYTENMNWTWLIRLNNSQYIEMHAFIEIRYDSTCR